MKQFLNFTVILRKAQEYGYVRHSGGPKAYGAMTDCFGNSPATVETVKEKHSLENYVDAVLQKAHEMTSHPSTMLIENAGPLEHTPRMRNQRQLNRGWTPFISWR